MRLPSAVSIYGNGPEVLALSELFKLFIPESFCYSLNTVEKDIEKKSIPCGNILLVFVLTQQGEDSVSFLINRLMLIRFKRDWRGAVLVIADHSQVEQVQKWELFKLQEGNHFFAQLCLARPVLIGNLVDALSILRPYYPNAWQLVKKTLKDHDRIQEAWELFNKVETEFSNTQWLADTLKELFHILIDEKLVLKSLIGHDGFNTIRKFAAHIDESPRNFFKKYHLGENKDVVLFSLREIMRRIPQWENQCKKEIK